MQELAVSFGGALAALVLVAAWQSHAALPTARTEVTAVAFGREIAVAGGFLTDGSSSRHVDLYAPASNSWRRAPDLPVGVNHAASAVVRGRLYVLGGSGAERSAFALVAGAWQTIALPAPRRAAGAAVVGRTIYLAGGVAAGGLARTMLAYDTQRGRWRTLPGPTPREHLAVTAARGRVYVIAGRTSGLGTGAATVGGTIVSVGGEAPNGTLEKVYAYDVVKRRWRQLADLPTPRHGLGVATLGGRVFVIGGGPQPGLHVSGANESLEVPK